MPMNSEIKLPLKILVNKNNTINAVSESDNKVSGVKKSLNDRKIQLKFAKFKNLIIFKDHNFTSKISFFYSHI